MTSEYSRGLEFGWRYSSERARISVAVFDNEYDNFIESFALAPAFAAMGGIDPSDGLRTFQSINRDKVTIDGIELKGEVSFSDAVSMKLALAMADGTDVETGQPLNSIEPLTGVLGFAFKPSDRFGFELIATGVEGKDEATGKNAIMELMKAVDETIPQPDRPKDKAFLMPVEDVFSISGRGTVVTGRVEQGVVKTGEEIEIVGIRETKKSVCTGVEMFRKILDTGEAGDNIGALLRGVERTDVERGQVLCKPGSITPHTEFECQAYILKKEEGGVVFGEL